MSKVAAAALIMLDLVGTLHAVDKSPNQMLGGGSAASNSGSSRYYDGKGSFCRRSTTSGNTTWLYDGQGKYSGSKTK